MKKILISTLIITIIALCALITKDNKNVYAQTDITAANLATTELFNEYYNNGVYQKETTINLNSETLDEVQQFFHTKIASLNKTTYYMDDKLWMSSNNGYSGYGTKDGKLTQFRVSVDGIEGPETVTSIDGGMEGHYCTLYDFVEGKHLSAHVTNELDLLSGWQYIDGVLCSTNEDVLNGFRLFTAPLWLDTPESRNYITFRLATIQEQNNKLIMKLWASSEDIGKFETEEQITLSDQTYHLFSTAVISYDRPSSPITLVYNLKMDGIANYDSVSRNEVGSYVGTPTLVSGKTGNALQLDGTNGIKLDSVDLSNAFTLEFDFKCDKVPAGYETLVSKANYQVKREWGIYLTRVSATQMGIKLNVLGTTAEAKWRGAGGNISIGEWHHVKVMATDKLIYLFIDGVCFGNYEFVRNDTKTPITIGYSESKESQHSYALIDEIKLSNGIDYVDTLSSKINTQDLKLRYSFENDTNFAIKDLIGTDTLALKSYSDSITDIGVSDSKISNGVDGGFGLLLNGSNKLTTTYKLNTKSDMTLGVYFKAEKTSGTQAIIAQADYSVSRDFSLYIENGTLKSNTRASNAWSTTTIGTIETGKWYYVVITIDYNASDNSSILKAYLNGELVKTTTAKEVNYSGAIPMTIGGSGSSSNHQYFTGSIDEIIAYSRVLTIDEIKANMANKLN